MAFGFVLRGNRLASHARIRLSTKDDGAPLIEDVIIENNNVQNAAVGIEIAPRSTRVLARGNRLDHVSRPVVDEHNRMEVESGE